MNLAVGLRIGWIWTLIQFCGRDASSIRYIKYEANFFPFPTYLVVFAGQRSLHAFGRCRCYSTYDWSFSCLEGYIYILSLEYFSSRSWMHDFVVKLQYPSWPNSFVHWSLICIGDFWCNWKSPRLRDGLIYFEHVEGAPIE